MTVGPWAAVAGEGARISRGGQWAVELEQLLDLVAIAQPAVIVEIGTRQGGTLWAFSQAAPDAALVSIDPTNERRFLDDLVGRDRELHLLTGRSQDPWTLIALERILDGRPVDFLFVDGSHTFDDVTRDVAMYGPLVDDAGYVALHDIRLVSPHTLAGVDRVWAGLRELPGAVEYVDPDASPPMGIGVVPARALRAK